MTRSPFGRAIWLSVGIVSVILGVIGVFLPILPTVPFMILAAFCFARSNKAWERKLLDHPRYGPPLRAWREKGIVGRRAKIAATIGFAGSIIIGLMTLKTPWVLVPPAVAVVSGSWLWMRPEE